MALVVSIILGMLALAFVLYPLVRRTPGDGQPVAARVTQETQTESEQSARSALQEVELDYQLGNIAEPDYRTLRERYMRRALVALKSRYDREQELDKLIEEQLRRLREEEQ
jgi:ABC-type microcin C transport system permease subunit YejB